MFTAKQAKEISNKKYNEAEQDFLNKMEKGIREAAAHGLVEFSYNLYHTKEAKLPVMIINNVAKTLRQNGYKVKVTCFMTRMIVKW